MAKLPDNTVNFSIDNAKGTSGQVEIEIRGSKRRLKPYTILATELKAFSAWNAIQNQAYNIAFSAISFGIALIIQAFSSDWSALPPIARAITIIGVIFSALVGIASWRVGKYLAKSSKTLDEMIEAETLHD